MPANDPVRRLAATILHRVETGGAFAGVLLDQAAQQLPHSRDRGLLRQLVLGVLRQRGAVDHALAQVSSRKLENIDPELLVLLRLGAYGLLFLDRVPDFATVDSAVELAKVRGDRRHAGFVNGVLRELARRGSTVLPPPAEPGDVAGLARQTSHPQWWVERLTQRMSWAEAWALLVADNEPAPTVLRPNRRRGSVDQVQAELAADGLGCTRGRYLPDALRVVTGSSHHSARIRAGWAWPQDEASQLVPCIFGELRGSVLDACAAPGGKTLMLSEALPPAGLLLAADRHFGRLRRLSRRCAQVGAGSVIPLQADMSRSPLPFATQFDHVLVDAPCSGSGTFRRHPELRWRLQPDDLAHLAQRQARLLDACAAQVAPGGSLVYSVCSIEPEEGVEQIQGFLERHSDWQLTSAGRDLPESCRELVDERGFLHTLPGEAGLDGFFAALLVRTVAKERSCG